MDLSLALLLTPLVAGFAVAVWRLWHDRDARLAGAAALLPALAARHLLAPPMHTALSWMATADFARLGLDFGINVLAAAGVITLARSLHERDRAEHIQWNSMESVRALAELLAGRRGDRGEALPELLALGCDRLGLELGVYTHIENGRSSALAIHGPADSPIKPGDEFELAETPCHAAIGSEAPVAIERVSGTHWAAHAEWMRLGIESYLGVRVTVHGETVGCLYFAGRSPCIGRFGGVDKQLVGLMGEWLGGELEREQLTAKADEAAATRSAVPDLAEGRLRLIPRRGDEIDRRRVDVNAALGQLEAELREAVGEHTPLALVLAPENPVARLHRHEFDRVLWSLLWQAFELKSAGGGLTIATEATLDPPEITATPFLTLKITAQGTALDSDGVAALFHDRESAAPIATRQGRLSLRRAQRLLRRSDGDISVHSDPREGTTLTAYLPAWRAELPARKSSSATSE